MERAIYLASENPEKVRVVRQAWEPETQIKTLATIGAIMPPEIEDKITYEENAYVKAMWLFKKTGQITIADDSGMEIVGLNGQPGVFTRRWTGESSDEEALMAKTVDAVRRLPESGRACNFVICAAAIIDVRNWICVVEKDSGVLLLTPRGEVIPGHPLASLLWLPERKATMAELRSDPQFEPKDVRAHQRLRQEILKFNNFYE